MKNFRERLKSVKGKTVGIVSLICFIILIYMHLLPDDSLNNEYLISIILIFVPVIYSIFIKYVFNRRYRKISKLEPKEAIRALQDLYYKTEESSVFVELKRKNILRYLADIDPDCRVSKRKITVKEELAQRIQLMYTHKSEGLLVLIMSFLLYTPVLYVTVRTLKELNSDRIILYLIISGFWILMSFIPITISLMKKRCLLKSLEKDIEDFRTRISNANDRNLSKIIPTTHSVLLEDDHNYLLNKIKDNFGEPTSSIKEFRKELDKVYPKPHELIQVFITITVILIGITIISIIANSSIFATFLVLYIIFGIVVYNRIHVRMKIIRYYKTSREDLLEYLLNLKRIEEDGFRKRNFNSIDDPKKLKILIEYILNTKMEEEDLKWK